MIKCEVCGAAKRACGHTPLVLPVVDLAFKSKGPEMAKRAEPPMMPRQSVRVGHGVAGWRNARVFDPTIRGVPQEMGPAPEAAPEIVAAEMKPRPTRSRTSSR